MGITDLTDEGRYSVLIDIAGNDPEPVDANTTDKTTLPNVFY